MIFATVGSQKFPFNRLIQAVDDLVGSGCVDDAAFAQTGCCTYEPKYIEHKAFLGREEFKCRMLECDTVITHGGTGAIIGAVKVGKKVVAVPRLAEYGEHVDNHQIEIVNQFAEMGMIEPCFDLDKLEDAYKRLQSKDYFPYESNTKHFIVDLASYLDVVGGNR